MLGLYHNIYVLSSVLEKKMKNNLKNRRQILSLTQKQVAYALGIAESAYQRYERGDVAPTVYVAIRIARALDTTVEALFQIDDDRPASLQTVHQLRTFIEALRFDQHQLKGIGACHGDASFNGNGFRCFRRLAEFRRSLSGSRRGEAAVAGSLPYHFILGSLHFIFGEALFLHFFDADKFL